MDADYCVPCQEAHKMSDACLQDVQCKLCLKKGHLRIDCPGKDVHSLEKDEDVYRSYSKKRKRSLTEVMDDDRRNVQKHKIGDTILCYETKKQSLPTVQPASSPPLFSKAIRPTLAQAPTLWLTPDQRTQIIHECVEDKISPTTLARKWQCNADTIRSWVRKYKYKKSL